MAHNAFEKYYKIQFIIFIFVILISRNINVIYTFYNINTFKSCILQYDIKNIELI